MSEYKYLLSGYDYTKIIDPEFHADVRLIGIYNTYDEAFRDQKKLGIVKLCKNHIKGKIYCSWIHKVKLNDGLLTHSLSLSDLSQALPVII